MSQTVAVISIYFFKLQNSTEVDETCSLPPDPVAATLCYQLLTTRILPWIIEGRIRKPEMKL